MLAIALLFIFCTKSTSLFKRYTAVYAITSLVGRNRKAVEGLLGLPMRVGVLQKEGSLGWTKAFYCQGEIEIVYIDHVADWITVDGKQRKLIEELISFLGVRFIPANIANLGVVRYYQIAGLAEVAFFGDREGKIAKVYIKAFTT
jgi:hypothetical protein